MTCGSPTPLHALPLPCCPRPHALQSARWRGTGPVVLPRGTGGCPSRLREGPEFSPSVTTRSCCSCPCAHSTAPRPGRATPPAGPAPPAPPEPPVTASFSEGSACPGSWGRSPLGRDRPSLSSLGSLSGRWGAETADRQEGQCRVCGRHAVTRGHRARMWSSTDAQGGASKTGAGEDRPPGRRRAGTGSQERGLSWAREESAGESRLTERQAGSPVLPICSLKGEGFVVVRRSGRTDGDRVHLASQVWWLGSSRWKDLTRRDRTDHFT